MYKKKEKLIKLAEIAEPVLKCLYTPMAALAGISHEFEKALFWPLIEVFSRRSRNDWYQYISYPKNETDFPLHSGNWSDFAILLTGKIVTRNNFTIDTIKMYRCYYPGAKIILSTWKGTSECFRRDLEVMGVILVENEEPVDSGPSSGNYQQTTALGGAKQAQELGCSYTWKTRCDMRFYRDGLLGYFLDLLRLFPVEGEERARAIYLSYGSCRKLPFFLCDFMAFSTTEEILKMYSVEMDHRPSDYHNVYKEEEYQFLKKYRGEVESQEEVSPYDVFPDFDSSVLKYMFVEQHNAYQFYKETVGINKYQSLLDNYERFLRNYVIIVDYQPMLLFWASNNKQRIIEQQTVLDAYGRADFAYWLGLLRNSMDISEKQ